MIIGIDLGGTKTRVVAESGGQTVRDTVVPTRSWQRGELLDDEGNAGRLLDLIHDLDDSATASIAIGAHGLDSDWQIREFSARMSAQHSGSILAVNDVELVAPAAGLDHAIAVIVGTGSKVVGHAADGSTVNAGGHGFLLSDPGSAASLARDGVKALLDAYDLGEKPDRLADEFMRHFGVGDIVELSYAFSADARLATWAPLAPLVFTAADAGSELASTVIDDSARTLARDVGRVHARGAVGTSVICAGGVITNQPRLYRALARHIDDLGLGLTVELLTVAPVVGAVALARKLSPAHLPHNPTKSHQPHSLNTLSTEGTITTAQSN
ncbi:MAG TPA: BadF/BadG/BcrA/BcrD ATPase family protein [Galbitalea sp.]